ncbi:MAG: serine/threonine protein kinase [Sandaracinaceae bacterium]|nr:serine/threonine protein kinase [Sandaracinaceae bacterium]
MRSQTTEQGEPARALLQRRVALFFMVLAGIGLLSLILGAYGAITEPGVDSLFVIATTTGAAVCWGLTRSGERSVRFSRVVEASGLLFNNALAAWMGRYLLIGFAEERGVAGGDELVMADGYISMLLLGGTAMLVSIRAALIPSTPRRTVLLTALVGVPLVAVPALFMASPDGAIGWRGLDSSAWPWLPATEALMWGFAVLTCAVISWVIYGLRAEVREAQRLGQYVIDAKLGEGGMGVVYRAHHAMMRRPTAVKLLRPDLAGEENIQRFEREVQLTARLTHPNTITIFDYGRTADDVFYYAMELLDGATLQRLVAVDGAQPAGRVVRILTMACGALSEAHALGLIHRDIKPANIMLCGQGGELDVVKVLDFGLVKELEVDRDVDLTGADRITGTPQYMAPESILTPDAVDARTDLYALGAVAYYLLAGAHVFEGKSVVEICSQHLHTPPPPLSERGVEVPSELEAVVLACLEKDPERRPQSAEELRRRVVACGVGAWDGERARAWWRERGAALEAPDETEQATTKTIEVARFSRDRAP